SLAPSLDLLCWLHQLKPIPERISHIHPMIAFERLIGNELYTCTPTPLNQLIQPLYQQGRMGFLRRSEIFLNAEVDLQVCIFEPHATTLGQMRRLGLLPNTQHPSVERTGFLFLTWGHGKLEMIYGIDFQSLFTSTTQDSHQHESI